MNDNKNGGPKILIIRLSSLGDIVLSSPVYKNIKAAWPDAHITILVKRQFADILCCHPDVDDIMVLKTNSQTLKEIKAGRFTHLIDLHANFRSMLLSALSGIPNRVRYNKNSLARRLFVKFRHHSPELEKHTLEKYLDVLKEWNIPVKYKEPELGDWSYKGQAVTGKKINKIGIFQTSFIGDSVLTTPLIQKTKKLFPEAKIVVITRPQTQDIFKNMPEVSEIILNEKKGFIKKIKGVFQTAREIRNSGIDILLVPHRSFRSAFIAWLSKVPIRVGFTSSEGWFLYTKTVPFSWMAHDAERNLSLLHGIVKENFTAEELNLKSIPTPEDNVARLLKEFNLEGKILVGIHPGSAWPTKCWFAERYAELALKMIKELGVKIVLVGDRKDSDLGESIRQHSDADIANLCGKTSLTDLMALMRHFKLFITNDSGPMHIATAFGVPTLAIFGPTTKELGFFPYGKGHRVVEIKDLPCRPCALHGGKKCPLGHFKCMGLITTDMVFEQAKEMLKENKVI